MLYIHYNVRSFLPIIFFATLVSIKVAIVNHFLLPGSICREAAHLLVWRPLRCTKRFILQISVIHKSESEKADIPQCMLDYNVIYSKGAMP